MDDPVLILMAAAVTVMAAVVCFGFVRLRIRDRQARVVTLGNVEGALGSRAPVYVAHPRQAPAPAEHRADIDACLARIFAKQAVRHGYAGVSIDDIPSFALRELDKAIDEAAHIKNTRSILGKIDSLEDRIDELVSLVATDPLLTASLLRLANSAFYGVTGQVASIRYAIDVVGLFSLKNLVYREYVLRQRKGAAITDPALFATVWEHALLTATSSAFLAGAFPGVDPAEAYMAGLLHDIGKFLLLSSGFVETAEDRCVRPYCGSFAPSTALVWRHDHALAGKIAALKWDFGREMAEAIGMHHYPELVPLPRVKADSRAVRFAVLLHVANQVAKHFSREPQVAGYIAPLHFSYHHLADQQALRSIMADSQLISSLAKIKRTMAL